MDHWDGVGVVVIASPSVRGRGSFIVTLWNGGFSSSSLEHKVMIPSASKCARIAMIFLSALLTAAQPGVPDRLMLRQDPGWDHVVELKWDSRNDVMLWKVERSCGPPGNPGVYFQNVMP